ncbi:MAG: hypothetical protein ACOYLK_13220 [Sphingomonas sp.]
MVLVLQLGLVGGAFAADNRLSFPKQFSLSPKGVNIQTGRFSYQQTDLSIGPFKLVRSWGDSPAFGGFGQVLNPSGGQGLASGWSHNLGGGITTTSSGGIDFQRVVVDSTEYLFKFASGNTYAPANSSAQGMVLTVAGTQWSMTDRSGAVFAFYTHSTGNRLLQRALYADGSAISYTYTSTAQIKLAVSNLGYAVVFDAGANQNITAVCGFNTTQVYVSASTTCSGATLKVGYAYDATGARLTSVTDASGGVTNFTNIDTGTGQGYLVTCISLVNSATCAIQNAFGSQPGDVWSTKRDQVRVQTTATGNVWRYSYTPPENPSDVPTQPCWPYWSSAEMTDAAGVVTIADYDRGYLVHIEAPDGITDYRYPNGCLSGTAGTTPISVETRLPHPTLVRKPGGIREYYEFDRRGNITLRAVFPKDVPDPNLTNGGQWVPTDSTLNRCCLALGSAAIPTGSNVVRATYLLGYGGGTFDLGCGSGPSDAKLCDKPTATVDPRNNQTDYTYDPAHGGVLTETAPAVGGVRPQTRSTYVQRQAWLRTPGGGYAPTGEYVWLLASKSLCKTGAASGAGCALGSADEVRTTYEYGPDSGPNNLLLRGVVNDATGIAARTCYGYDWQGNKISETKPLAGLGSCQ